MPTLIRLEHGEFRAAEDRWSALADADPLPPGEAPLLVSAARLEGDEPLAERPLGVLLTVEDAVEAVAPRVNRLSLVALDFPKFRDGRALTAARLLRERWRFGGEVRAVGDVRRDQAFHMVRCGFDAFLPADGSTPEEWARSATRHHHVYTAASDGRAPAYAEPSRREEARRGV